MAEVLVNEPVLTKQDRDSACWQKIKKHLEAQLQKCRAANDQIMDQDRRNRLGGNIARIKAILALDTDAPVMSTEDELFRD